MTNDQIAQLWLGSEYESGAEIPVWALAFARKVIATQQPVAQKYDDTLIPFGALMRNELHANSRKGDRPGWLAMSREQGLLEIYWHTAKLSAAVKNNDAVAIAEHSADVANMAMMLLDVCGGLAAAPSGVTKQPEPAPTQLGAPDEHRT